jgi:hypothetical protein
VCTRERERGCRRERGVPDAGDEAAHPGGERPAGQQHSIRLRRAVVVGGYSAAVAPAPAIRGTLHPTACLAPRTGRDCGIRSSRLAGKKKERDRKKSLALASTTIEELFLSFFFFSVASNPRLDDAACCDNGGLPPYLQQPAAHLAFGGRGVVERGRGIIAAAPGWTAGRWWCPCVGGDLARPLQDRRMRRCR